jgi:hypothetical protein
MRSMPQSGNSAEERFRQKYVVADSGCWLWTGATTGSGHRLVYGRFYDSEQRRVGMATHWSYIRSGRNIGKGLELDHLCRNTLCVNPDHLEAVTRRENVVRGTSPNAINARKTHCIRGHELTQQNCYATKWPRARQCKQCAQLASRAKAKKRQTNDLDSAERNATALSKAIHELG